MTLAAKVKATNEVNKLAIEIHNKINTILTPYLGKKVVKTTPYSSFIKKINDEMNALNYSIIFHFYTNSITAEVTHHYSISEHRRDRVKKHIQIAMIDLDVLTGLNEPEELKEYNLEEVEAAFNRIRELEDEKLSLRSTIYPFVN